MLIESLDPILIGSRFDDVGTNWNWFKIYFSKVLILKLIQSTIQIGSERINSGPIQTDFEIPHGLDNV